MALAEVQERKTQRKTRGKPNAVDIHVGTRVRQRRTLLGFSQERLASALDLTFQQVQKYERGANRIGASRLFDLSLVLDVPVAYFFEDMPENVADSSPRKIAGLKADPEFELEGDPLTGFRMLMSVAVCSKWQSRSLSPKKRTTARLIASGCPALKSNILDSTGLCCQKPGRSDLRVPWIDFIRLPPR